MEVHPSDVPFPANRVVRREKSPDGRPWWLAVTRAEDGLVQYRWDMAWATKEEAFAAAEGLIQLGAVHRVFVFCDAGSCAAPSGYRGV